MSKEIERIQGLLSQTQSLPATPMASLSSQALNLTQGSEPSMVLPSPRDKASSTKSSVRQELFRSVSVLREGSNTSQLDENMASNISACYSRVVEVCSVLERVQLPDNFQAFASQLHRVSLITSESQLIPNESKLDLVEVGSGDSSLATMDETHSELHMMMERLGAVERATNHILQMLARADVIIRDLQAEKETVERAEIVVREECTRVQAALGERDQQISQLTLIIKEYKAKLKENKVMYSDKLQEYRTEVAQFGSKLKENHDEFEGMIGKSEEEIDALNNERNRIDEELRICMQRLEATEKECRRVKEEFKKQLEEMEKESERKENEYQRIIEKLSATAKGVGKLQDAVREGEQERQVLQDELSKQVGVVASLEYRLQRSRTTNESPSSSDRTLNKMVDEKQRLHRKISELERYVGELQTKIQKKNQNYEKSLEVQKNNSEQEQAQHLLRVEGTNASLYLDGSIEVLRKAATYDASLRFLYSPCVPDASKHASPITKTPTVDSIREAPMVGTPSNQHGEAPAMPLTPSAPTTPRSVTSPEGVSPVGGLRALSVDSALWEQHSMLRTERTKSDLNSKCAQLQHGALMLERDLRATQTQLENSNAILCEKTDELSKIKDYISSLNNENQALKLSIYSLENLKTDLQGKLRNLELELSTKSSSLENHLYSENKTIQILESKLNSTKDSLSNMQTKLANSKRLETDLKMAHSEINGHKKELVYSLQTIKDLEVKLERLRSELERKTVENGKLQEDKIDADDEQEYRGKITELEKLLSGKQALIEELLQVKNNDWDDTDTSDNVSSFDNKFDK